jgi:hypothetical protein
MRIFGDSLSTNSTASGASSAANSMAGLSVGAEYNAISGYKADTLANLVRLKTVDNRECRIMIGANDVHIHKNDVQEQTWFKDFLMCSVAWLLMPAKKFARTAGNFTFTGSWGNTAVNTFGKYTDQANASAEGTFEGDAFYVFYIMQKVASAIADVYVDNVLIGQLNSDGTIASSSIYADWAHACHRFAGFGAGTHTFKVVSRGGVRFYFDGIADTVQTNAAKVILSNIHKFSAAYYTAQSISVATTDAYNVQIAAVVSELAGDGHNIVLCDNYASIDPLTDLKPDGIHWNDAGHAKGYANFEALSP